MAVMSDFAVRYVTSSNLLRDFDKVSEVAARLVAHTSSDQLDNPTPCPGWTVRDMVNHLVETVEVYGEVASGTGGPIEGERRSYADPAASFQPTVATTRASFAVPEYLTVVAATPIGPHPGSVVVQHEINELTMHGWDLARATGQDHDFLPDVAEASIASWRAFFSIWDRAQLSFNFGPEQAAPAGACATDRLAAYLGRILVEMPGRTAVDG